MRITTLACLLLAIAASATPVKPPRYVETFDRYVAPVTIDKEGISRALSKATSDCHEIRVLALVDAAFSEACLAAAGARLVSRIGDVASIEVCDNVAPYLRTITGIRYVKMPHPIFPCMDSARVLAHINEVQDATLSNLPRSYQGRGVLVGVMDTGFDVFHPAFRDSLGRSRFVAVWDQQDTTVKNQNRFGYGIIKTRAQIEQDSLFGIDSAESHGTHTSSLAAGGPSTFAYRGAAPQAMIAGVRYAGEDNDLVDGMKWLFDLADSLGVPCVINASIGIAWGPHDGTSLFDRALDSLSGPGHIVVGAVGNDGDKHNHAAYALAAGQSKGSWAWPALSVQGDKVNAYSAFEMWGEPGKNFSVSCRFLDTLTRISYAAGSSISTSTNRTVQTPPIIMGSDTCWAEITVESPSPLNNKPHAKVLAFTTSSRLWLGVSASVASSANAQTVHTWNAYKQRLWSFGIANYIEGDSNFSVNEIGGTADSIITVGAFVSKRDIVLWNGSPLTTYDNGELGDLADFSGIGPRVDGRNKPDITAPGSTVTGAIANYALPGDYLVRWPDVSNTKGRYACGTGTSQASPIVAGIVALMLQVDPTLGPSRARQVLQETASTDGYTGAIVTPNARWGAGKANALHAVQKLLGITPGQSAVPRSAAVGASAHISLMRTFVRIAGAREVACVEIVDMLGRVVSRAAPGRGGVTILPRPLVPGVYTARAVGPRGATLLVKGVVVGR